MKIIATTTLSQQEPEQMFRQFLQESGVIYVPRQGRGIKVLREMQQADLVVVWQNQGPVLHWGDRKFFFHPSMAKIRLAAHRNQGQTDPLIEAARVKATDAILDCTLGLGADSVVLSYFTPAGEVTSLESSRVIAYTIKWGMRLYKSDMPWLDKAVHRVGIKALDHLSYLQQLPDNCYDVVYFDPMFRKPLLKSETLSPVRVLGNKEPLTIEAIHEAKRVARRCVLIKERSQSLEFSRLGCQRVVGGPNRQIHFGIIDIF